MQRTTIIVCLGLCATAACGADETSGEASPAAPAAPSEEEAPENPPADQDRPERRLQEPALDALGAMPDGVGVAVGEAAPDARVEDANGEAVQLAELRERGPILLVFYRGGWCPFCNLQIHSLVEAYPEYQRRGVTPVAISVDRPEAAAATRATYEIPFPVLADPDLAAHEAYRVGRTVPPEELERLRGFGMDLEEASGRDHHVIAIPALFFIDQAGVVRWAHADSEGIVGVDVVGEARVTIAEGLGRGGRPERLERAHELRDEASSSGQEAVVHDAVAHGPVERRVPARLELCAGAGRRRGRRASKLAHAEQRLVEGEEREPQRREARHDDPDAAAPPPRRSVQRVVRSRAQPGSVGSEPHICSNPSSSSTPRSRTRRFTKLK